MPKKLLRLLPVLTVSAALGASACGGPGDAAGNQPPVAQDDHVSFVEDAPIELDVLANDHDPEGDALTIRGANAPGHEVTVIGGQRITVRSDANFSGSFVLTYTVTDGEHVATAEATVLVTPVNDAPVATPITVTTGLDLPVSVTLVGTDVDGDTLGYEVLAGPGQGTLSGTAPSLVYTPRSGFHGDDVFTYRVHDAELASEPVTVTITVDAGSPPVAADQMLVTPEDTPGAVTLTGSDPDGDALTFVVVEPPAHGTLTGTPPTLIYTPAPDYSGSDSFRFTASDGTLTSVPAQVTIEVTPENDPPVVQDLSLTLAEDTPRVVALGGTDPESQALAVTIVTPPAHGTLGGTGSARTYTPAADFHGDDSFTFTVSDGQLTSALATVSLRVESVPDAPVATNGTFAATEDTPATIALAARDGDGDELTYAITGPAHGTLTGTAPTLTYTPAANYNGDDTFTFTASDGQLASAPATVAIHVAAVDDPPVIASATMTGPEGELIPIPVPVTDADGEVLTYNVVTFAPHGNLYLGGPDRFYREFGFFNGVDTFTLTASDGHTTSAPATFTVTVTPVNDAPLVRDDLAIAFPGADLRIDVLSNDTEVDGEPMTIDAVSAPVHGDVVIDGDALVYTPAEGNVAPDSFTYTVRDPSGLTGTATVTVGIGEFPSGLPPRLVRRVTTTAQALQHDVSADGRYVAFLTHLPVGSGDTNGVNDVYLYDRLTDKFERISVDSAGTLANGASERPSISGDGRYVAFASAASNLVPGDTNGVTDVFVRDRVQHTTVRVSVGPGGAQVSGASNEPDLSADGRFVAFQSASFQLIPSDANGATDVFVRDLVAGTTARVSIRTGGGEGDTGAFSPAISGDGRVVAFHSAATNLVTGDTNNLSDVFVHDRATGTTERVSVSSTGLEANAASAIPAISFDGRFVAFRTAATNLIPGVSSPSTLVRDRQGVTTTYAFTAADSLSLSGDGRYLAAHLANGTCFVRDRFAGVNHLFSDANGNDLFYPVLSANGRYVALTSSSQVIPGQGTAGANLYLLANPL